MMITWRVESHKFVLRCFIYPSHHLLVMISVANSCRVISCEEVERTDPFAVISVIPINVPVSCTAELDNWLMTIPCYFRGR